MAATGYAGKFGRVTVGAGNVKLFATRWAVLVRSAEIDITNFEDNGFANYVTIYQEAEIDIEAMYPRTGALDGAGGAAVWPHANPPNIKGGTELTNVLLYTDRTGTWQGALVAWNFPSIVVIELRSEQTVRDAVKYSFRARAQGEFTYMNP